MRHILISTALAAVFLAASSAAGAGTIAAADQPTPDEVIVTAKRATADALHIGAPIADLPIAVQVVPIQTIQDQGFVRLGDAVRDISGVTRKEAYFGINDSFGIRGFDASTGLLNGFRHEYYGGLVDVAHVQSVEVIKGPASVTTGFLEPGGVVNVITKRPTADPITELTLQGGSYGFGRVEADVSRKLSDQVAVRLTGADQTSDSFRDYIKGRRYSLGGAVDWTPTSKTKVEMSAYYTDSHATPDRGLPPDPIDLTIPIQRFFGEPTDSYHQDNREASIVLTQEIAAGLSLRTGFDWSREHDLRKNTQAESLQPDGHSYSRDYTIVPESTDTKTAFVELDGRFSTFGLAHRVTAGVDYTKENERYLFLDTDVDGAFVSPLDIYNPVYGIKPGPVASDGRFSGGPTDVGFYLNDVISYGPFDLLLGVRQDRFTYYASDLDYPPPVHFAANATTPRVGLVYKPAVLRQFGTVSLYANYAESFNPQLYVTLRPGVTAAPSQGKQVEVGTKFESADGRYTASLAAFHITKTNVATPDPTDPTGVYSILAGEDRSQGLELDVSARPVDGLKLLFAASNIRADVRRDSVLPIGDRLVNVPETQATFTARYDIPHTPWGLGGSVYYVGAREAMLPNTFAIPSYTRVDAAVFYKLTPKVELALNIQNVGDVRYYDSQNYGLFPGAPTSVLGSVRLSF